MSATLIPREEVRALGERLRREGRRIAFANGCFDILHVGHVRYLEGARQCGDVLVVGVNSDRAVAELKGMGRPILPAEGRAEMVAALESVDYVVLFDEPDPLHLIEALKPNVLVKGADWPKSRVVGREIVEKIGGQVVRVPLVAGASTTRVIEKIIKAYCGRGKRRG